MDVRPDGFTLEFQEHAHVKTGGEFGKELQGAPEKNSDIADEVLFNAAG